MSNEPEYQKIDSEYSRLLHEAAGAWMAYCAYEDGEILNRDFSMKNALSNLEKEGRLIFKGTIGGNTK